ncbi:MAG: glycosyltransferase family 2 protein [Sporolactobacillus sp.]
MELVTAIITTYKRPINIVKRAVESVLSQTYPKIELIVVNDSPTEKYLVNNIAILLESYKRNIKYIVHKKNLGACAARNTGLKAAHGRFIAFLDDDDEWIPEKIEDQIKYMNDRVELVYCASYIISGDKTKIHYPRYPKKNIFRELLKCNYIGSTSFPLLRTDCLKKLGGFDTNLESCQDYDMWLRVLEKGSAAYVGKPLVRYYISHDSTFKKDNKKFINGEQYLSNKHKELYRLYPKSYSYHLNEMALNGLIKKDINMYIFYKTKAWRFKWFSYYNFLMLPKKLVDKLKEYINFNHLFK